MLTCKTVDCSQKGVEHTVHPEGITVVCGVCGIALDEVTVSE